MSYNLKAWSNADNLKSTFLISHSLRSTQAPGPPQGQQLSMPIIRGASLCLAFQVALRFVESKI